MILDDIRWQPVLVNSLHLSLMQISWKVGKFVLC